MLQEPLRPPKQHPLFYPNIKSRSERNKCSFFSGDVCVLFSCFQPFTDLIYLPSPLSTTAPRRGMETNTLFLPGNRNNLLALKRWKVQFHSYDDTERKKKEGEGGIMFIPLSIHPNIRLSGHPSVSKSILFSWPNLPVIKKRLTESSDTYNEPKTQNDI